MPERAPARVVTDATSRARLLCVCWSKARNMAAMIRPLALMCAFVVGWFFPQGAVLAWTVPWFVRFMLFMVFLGLNVHKMGLKRSHFLILALNLGVGVFGCELMRVFGDEQGELAAAAFFTGLAPTATAAPAIASFLKREVEYVVTGLLLTTLGVALALPALLPWALNVEAGGDAFFGAFLHVAGNVASTIVAPIIAARLTRWIYPSSASWTARFKNWTFYTWTLMVTVISCRASEFIHDPSNNVSSSILLHIALLSLGICVTNFLLGFCVGEKGLREESSQTLGQKNTGAMIYFASLYASPLAALGPTIYVLWHNSWNAIQLQYLAIKESRQSHSGLSANQESAS